MTVRGHTWRGLRRIGPAAGLAGLLAAYAVVGAPPAPAPLPAAVEGAAEGTAVRQTESDAVALAAATGGQVEIGAFRSESAETYANPDGTLTSVEHAQPVRVVRDGRWVPTDATLIRHGDGTLSPRAATLGMRLSGGGNAPLVRVERAGRTMALAWPGPLPAPTVDGDKATYPEVLPGVDLVVSVGVTGFSHVLVIKSAEAARNPAVTELTFGLRTDGITVREDAEGGLTAVDATTGGPVLEAATPMMWDSGEPAGTPPATARARAADPAPAPADEATPPSANRTELDVELAGGQLTLRPDRAMLTDPATRWPVYVDPIWQDTRNSGWAMVASGYPNEKYWKFKGDEGVGECPVSSGWCSGVGVKRIYYALPTPYKGKTILNAEFSVTMTHTYNSSARKVSLYRAASGISSGTTWKNKPGQGTLQQTISPTNKQGSCTSTNQNVEFNVLGAVREAATKGWGTTTFGLRAENESDHTAWKRFCGNALLRVRYNRPPAVPAQGKLTMSPGGSCVSGASRPYVSDPPTLNAVLTDPDTAKPNPDKLKGEFKVSWTPPGGTQQTRTYTTGMLANGSRFTYQTKGLNLPENVVVAWEVRASDGTAWGPWSSYGSQTVCEFVYDKTAPASPDIDSPEYLPLDATDTTSDCVEDNEGDGARARGSVGSYGTFTFDSAAVDVSEYRYSFTSDSDAASPPYTAVKPATAGGPVTVRWMPAEDGTVAVKVKSVDGAGRTSADAVCSFKVPTRLPAASWPLDEAAGAGSAADTGGVHAATAGAGAVFGAPGPDCQGLGDGCQRDRAVRFSGAADSHLSTTTTGLVDTAGGFGVAAWVRLTDDTADRVAVSQDGTGQPGFTLGFTAATKKWTFTVPGTGATSAVSTAVAATGVWTHLAAAYDPVRNTQQLYVNGVAQPLLQRGSTTAASAGVVQIGRRVAAGGYTGQWVGDLAEVALYDRILVAREAVELSELAPARTAYWPLDTAVEGRSPESDGEDTLDLVLDGGAALYAPDPDADPPAVPAMVGSGHLLLDGTDDHARTGAAVAETGGSFTVTARVALASPTCGRNMTVVSQAATTGSGFQIRCTAANRWQVVLPHGDGSAQSTVAVDDEHLPSAEQAGQHLALVYNARLGEVTLYVDGQVADAATVRHPSPWRAAGALQVGRALAGGTYGEYFAGAVDEVRVYAGAADADLVQDLARPEARPEL